MSTLEVCPPNADLEFAISLGEELKIDTFNRLCRLGRVLQQLSVI